MLPRRWRGNVRTCRRTSRIYLVTTVSGGKLKLANTDSTIIIITLNRCQGLIWDLIEHPESSTAANIVSYIAMSFVLISTVVMSLNTMQVFLSVSSSQNYKNFLHLKGLKVLDRKGNFQPHPFLEIIEAICIAWFTLEFIIRYQLS